MYILYVYILRYIHKFNIIYLICYCYNCLLNYQIPHNSTITQVHIGNCTCKMPNFYLIIIYTLVVIYKYIYINSIELYVISYY